MFRPAGGFCGVALFLMAVAPSAESRDVSQPPGCPGVNRAPEFLPVWGLPPCSYRVEVPSQQPIRVSFTARDPDPDDVVTLSVIELPDIPNLQSSLPATGNPVSGTVRLEFSRRDGAGPHVVGVEAVDQCGARTECRIQIWAVHPNYGPDCSQARASVQELWPPSHEMVAVGILGVTDPDLDPVTVRAIGVTQDEPSGNGAGGSTCPDASISAGVAFLRAERQSAGNGRVYRIHFEAEDVLGAVCQGTVAVCVPRDRGRASACRDDGQGVTSTDACEAESRAAPLRGPRWIQAASGASPIQYELAEASEVDLAVYDVSGRRLITVDSGSRGPGVTTPVWSATSIPRGIYFLRLRTEGTVITRSLYLGR